MSIFQFLPLLVVLCLYAAYVRLAARVTRLLGVGWLQAFQFAALVMVLSMLGRVVSSYAGQAPFVAAALFGTAVHLALGAWFFRIERRLPAASPPDGQAVRNLPPWPSVCCS
jgi:uncharacterized membrane protein (DUF4010 family)